MSKQTPASSSGTASASKNDARRAGIWHRGPPRRQDSSSTSGSIPEDWMSLLPAIHGVDHFRVHLLRPRLRTHRGVCGSSRVSPRVCRRGRRARPRVALGRPRSPTRNELEIPSSRLGFRMTSRLFVAARALGPNAEPGGNDQPHAIHGRVQQILNASLYQRHTPEPELELELWLPHAARRARCEHNRNAHRSNRSTPACDRSTRWASGLRRKTTSEGHRP